MQRISQWKAQFCNFHVINMLTFPLAYQPLTTTVYLLLRTFTSHICSWIYYRVMPGTGGTEQKCTKLHVPDQRQNILQECGTLLETAASPRCGRQG